MSDAELRRMQRRVGTYRPEWVKLFSDGDEWVRPSDVVRIEREPDGSVTVCFRTGYRFSYFDPRWHKESFQAFATAVGFEIPETWVEWLGEGDE